MGKLGVKFNNNVFAAGKAKMKETGDYNDVTLPPGRYVCIIRRAKAQEVKGIPKVIFDLEVAGEAEQAGGRISVWNELTEEKIHYLLKVLSRLGYDVEALDDEDTLAAILEDIETNTPVVRVTAKQGGEYVNYYIDKKLDELTAAEVEKGGAEPAAEAEPEAAPEPAPAPAKPAPAKPAAKPAPAKPAPAPEPEPEAEPEADEYAAMDRTALKVLIAKEKLPIVVNKGMSDEDIRVAIRAAKPAAEPEAEAEPEAPADPEAVEIKAGLKCKASIKGKVVDVTVVSVNEDDGTVEVKTPTGKVKVPVAQLSL